MTQDYKSNQKHVNKYVSTHILYKKLVRLGKRIMALDGSLFRPLFPH